MRKSPVSLALVVGYLWTTLWAGSLRGVTAVRFEVPSGRERCIFDVLRKDQLATGEYGVDSASDGNVNVDISVTGPNGEEVFSKRKTDSGKFGFAAMSHGEHTICVKNNDMVERLVQLKLRSGVEAKDLSEIVQRHHLEPVAAEILRIKETVKSVRHELTELKQREAEMREMNESINTRVTLFSLFSILVVSTLGVWQVFYLRNYFAEKKLI